MILSSVTKHVKDQNWFAVWIDLLIVIVGVFIGIQVANWNESRVDETRAESYLERIVQDLVQDSDDMKKRMIFWKQVSNDGMNAIEYANTTENKSLSDWQILLAFFQASQIGEFYITTTTYDELVSTGDLGLINDIHIRNDISKYYNAPTNGVYTERPLYREHVRGYIPITLQNYIWDHCFATDAINQSFVNCASPKSVLNTKQILQTIINDKTLMRELRYWLSTLRIASILGEFQITNSHTLKILIQQGLTPKKIIRAKEANNP